MNTLKEYYKLEFICACGIPSVILEGTPDDWIRLKDVYERMKTIMMKVDDCELEHWIPCMDLVLKMLIDLREMAISGEVEAPVEYVRLWERVISFVPQGSGGDTILGGWISVLSPYSNKNVVKDIFKDLPCLDITKKISRDKDDMFGYHYQDVMKEFYGGVGWGEVQTSMFSTPATLKNYDCPEREIQIKAGFNVHPHVNASEEVEMNIGYEILKKNPKYEEMKTKLIDLGFKVQDDDGIGYLIYPYKHEKLAYTAHKLFGTMFGRPY